MNRIYSLLALAGALGCSSENTDSKTALPTGTGGSVSHPKSTGGASNASGGGGALNLSNATGGTQSTQKSNAGAPSFSDAGASNVPKSSGGTLGFSDGGASNATKSNGGAASLSGGGASNVTKSSGGTLSFSDGGASNVPGAGLPWKLAPTRETAQALLDRITALYQDYASAAPPQGTHRVVGVIVEESEAHSNAVLGKDWTIRATTLWLTLPKMTLDVLAVASCHELGHFVGGFPFKPKKYDPENGTATAAEGQADYFSTKDCLPRLWASEVATNAAAFAELDSTQRTICTKAHSDPSGQALCGRILLATLQAAQLYHDENVRMNGSFEDAPHLETPDPQVVKITLFERTGTQCRLDTMIAGLLCDVKQVGTTIPGLMLPYGQFSEASQDAARPFACQEGPGARPKCWFHPDSQETDCSTFGPMRCEVENGVLGVRTCDVLRGIEFNECFPGDRCETEGELASCVAAEQ